MYKAMIVKTETLHVVKRYKNKAAAKGALTRSETMHQDKYSVMTIEEFNAANILVTVKSLMGGKEVQIRKSDVGGCTDPSTNRYWSM